MPTNRRVGGEPAARAKGEQSRESGAPLARAAGSPIATLTVKGARQNNLKSINIAFPLGCFITVTGVSGSGKSSLVHEVLYSALARKFHRASLAVGAHDEIVGLEHVDKVINVDQDPLGNSPSSNPATYTGVFDLIRQLYAQLPESRVRGWQAKRFSFNKPGGRCEACEGNGQKKIEMHFLPDVWVECDVCQGSRFNPETLAVRYKGKSIADVLQMRVAEALELFGNVPKIRQILQTLADVGLDYLALGQAAPTLSGGEAQRVKLAAELSRPNTGKTVYILDEPTTGLHFDDICKLLDVLNRLVDLGNTVVVVEHNLDVIKTADWVIDLGPDAGAAGGTIVVAGTPETVAKSNAGSHTARFIAEALKLGPYADRPRYDPFAAEKNRDGDVALEDVGKNAAMPWQTDGRLWHTKNRLSGDGKPVRWEGAILDWIDEQVHALGNFGETNWKQPNIVEITGPQKSLGWFFHAHTTVEWFVRLVFRVGKNTFKEEELDRRLGLPTWDDTPEVQIYSSEPRVHVANRKGPIQEVAIKAYKLAEIDTPAFRQFLKQAVEAFQANQRRMQTKPEDLMPWKVNGERWHLGEKGFPPGRKLRWDRGVLPALIKVMRSVESNIEVDWNNRIAIAFRVPGISRAWARFTTKDPAGLACLFFGKKGQFNLAQIEPFGTDPAILQNSFGDVIRLTFLNEHHLHAARLQGMLESHLQGFRELFG